MRRRALLLSVVMALLAMGLVACGYSVANGGAVGTATTTTGPTHGVVVDVGGSSYATTDTIAVTVRNNLPDGITATDHQTSCTIVQLQMQVGSAWQNQGGCSLGIATRMVPLAAGSSTAVQLSPSAGQISAKPWPAGAYRVAFTYATGTPSAPGASETVYSAQFTVS